MSYAWQHNNLGGVGVGGGDSRAFDEDEDDVTNLLQPNKSMGKSKGKSNKEVKLNEKLFRVVDYIQQHARTTPMTLRAIEIKLGLDLSAPEIVSSLEANERIDVTNGGDGETKEFRYISEFPRVKDRASLAEMINQESGVTAKAIEDDMCYPGVADDIKDLCRCGDVLAVKNEDTAKQASIILHPRGIRFMVGLGEKASPHTMEQRAIETTQDLRMEVRRGDAVGACAMDSAAAVMPSPSGATWFRVSSTLIGAQRQWAQAPPSVSSVKELGKDRQDALDLKAKMKGELEEQDGNTKDLWAEPFTGSAMPLDKPAPDLVVGRPVALFKFGCTNDVRELWKATLAKLPSDDNELEKKLKLGPGAGQQRQKRKQQQRRRAPRKMKRVTNTHLDG